MTESPEKLKQEKWKVEKERQVDESDSEVRTAGIYPILPRMSLSVNLRQRSLGFILDPHLQSSSVSTLRFLWSFLLSA